jgi:methyl-accepting chemotaxis protein
MTQTSNLDAIGSDGEGHGEDAVHDAIHDYRAQVLALIQKAEEISERAVLDVGQNVNSIVRDARDYMKHLKESLGSVGDDTSEASVTHAIVRQSDAVASFMEDMGQHLRVQEDKAQQAVEQSIKIIEAANTIKTMAYTARILSLNAHIEAARLGSHGHAFQVIVKEMLKFSEVVEETNLKVSGLAEDLQELLPQIAHQTKTIRHDTEVFSDQLERLNGSVEESTHNLKEMVVQTMTDGDQRVQKVLDLSMQALSHLQFQDLMIQDVQRIDTLLYELHNLLLERLGSDQTPQQPRYMIRLGDAMKDDEKEDDEMLEEGELLLF